MLKNKIIAIVIVLMLYTVPLFSSESAVYAYAEGCKFYSEGDWPSAEIMLKKAVSYPENFRPDVYYMLITAELYAGDKKGALDDCNVYLSNFPDSTFYPRIKYYKGKILYDLGEYEKSIIELSDFCHQYVEDELYPYALFYIGEALYAGYKYEKAMGIFNRIVVEFPKSEKAPAAQYRIDTILQHSREEKLLYLLKQTGEEYLSAKEEYEKQLKMYNSETVNSTRQKLSDAQSRNNAFEKQIADLQRQLEVAKTDAKDLEAEIEAKKAEIESKNAEIESKNAEIDARDAEIESKKAEIDAKDAEIEAKAADALLEAQDKDNILAQQIKDLQKQLEMAKAESEKLEAERDAAIKKTNELAGKQGEVIYVPVPVIESEKKPIETKEQSVEEPVIHNDYDVKEVEMNIHQDNIDKDVPSLEPYDETKEQLRILKEKAREVQKILDSKIK